MSHLGRHCYDQTRPEYEYEYGYGYMGSKLDTKLSMKVYRVSYIIIQVLLALVKILEHIFGQEKSVQVMNHILTVVNYQKSHHHIILKAMSHVAYNFDFDLNTHTFMTTLHLKNGSSYSS